ncbi:MAG: hypothetical protein SNJ53_02095 [Thermodesulfovibrionales bacterium]
MNKTVQSLSNYFTVYFTEEDFIKKTYYALRPLGFNANNTLALVCLCRDEICQSLINHIHNQWGEAFNLSSLAAIFIAGETALRAGMSHAPKTEQRRKYVFYALPHIAISKDLELGKCSRFGIAESTACGALVGFYNELNKGILNTTFDENDAEFSILKGKLLKGLDKKGVSDLLSLTKLTRDITQRSLEGLINQIADPSQIDYAMITGIQIHAEDNNNYVAPDISYVVVNGQREEIKLE